MSDLTEETLGEGRGLFKISFFADLQLLTAAESLKIELVTGT